MKSVVRPLLLRPILFWVAAAVLVLLALPAFSETDSARQLVHLLDYLGTDYAGAVDPSGHIISESEYGEQKEFSQTSLALAQKLFAADRDLIQSATQLNQLVLSKAAPQAIKEAADKTKNQVIQLAHLAVAPEAMPDLQKGADLFKQNCVSCHGISGHGDGVAAHALNPRPANFWDPQRMDHLSPFKGFNSIRLGVQGTSMAGFPQLSDEATWDLAFYVVALRHQWIPTKSASPHVPVEKLATLSDEELQQQQDLSSDELASLRWHPAQKAQINFETARTLLSASLSDAKQARWDDAEKQALAAYLDGVEPLEPRIKAKDPNVLTHIEDKMAHVRQVVSARGSIQDLSQAIESADKELKQGDSLLSESSTSPLVTAIIAGGILFREGFEAILIIVAILGVTKASGQRKATLWVHGGWIVALAMGVLFWFFSGWLMNISGAQRETMEGMTALVAVGVLLYMGFWLHSKTEIHRWQQFIKTKMNSTLKGGGLFGLALISFTAVFREAFETVLFLRALWLEAGLSGRSALALGVLAAFVAVFVVGHLFLKCAAKIPLKQLFNVSSALMGVLAFILIGKGLHSLQETGFLSITSTPVDIRSDLVGFYPTVETTTAQVLIALVCIGLWCLGKRSKRASEPTNATPAH